MNKKEINDILLSENPKEEINKYIEEKLSNYFAWSMFFICTIVVTFTILYLTKS